MAVRTLDQIVAELGNVYDPLAGQIEQRRAALPGQMQAQEQGLQAKQEQAFGDILNGARRRGTGIAFGGIPLAEQAKYTATDYMPALANLRRTGQEQQMSLTDAILNLNKERRGQAQGIYDNEYSRDLQDRQMAEQTRQYNESLAFQKQQAAQQAAAQAAAQRASSASSFNPTYGRVAVPQQKAPVAAAPQTDPVTQNAYNFIKSKEKQGDIALVSDFNAAKNYYQKTGNPADLVKLNLYKQMYPQLFSKATWTQPQPTF